MWSRCCQNLNGKVPARCKLISGCLSQGDTAVSPETGRAHALVLSNCSSFKSIRVLPWEQGILGKELLCGSLFWLLWVFSLALVLDDPDSFKDVAKQRDHSLLDCGWKQM